jgi:hypothetical protein
MKVIITDGGRKLAGFKGQAGDCVARSIAIAAGRPYDEIYEALAQGNGTQRRSKRTGKRGFTAANGINTNRKWYNDYMERLGFVWTPTMTIGSGCRVHLRDGELPMGRLVVSVSKHATAVIDGVIHDTHDPARGGTRCVYGFWKLEGK